MKTLLLPIAVALMGLCFSGNLMAQDEGKAEVSSEVESADELGTDGDHSEAHADGDSHDEDHGDHADHGSEDDHGSHDGHADNDPTHANVGDATWGVVDFRTDMAFFSAIVFLLLLFGLMGTAWKPILEGLQKREDMIANNIANAEKASADAEAKLAEYEAKLESANEEAATVVADARKAAEAAGQKLVASAQEEAAMMKERATADIDAAKRVALGELAEQSTDVAMSVAQRVVGREVKADDHQGLIQEMLAKLPSKN